MGGNPVGTIQYGIWYNGGIGGENRQLQLIHWDTNQHWQPIFYKMKSFEREFCDRIMQQIGFF